MSSTNGLVSVIIPVFNGGSLLPIALQSLGSQDYVPLEVIIINDGSVDNSVKVLEKFTDLYDGDVKVLTHPGRQRRGLAASYRLGLEHCRGEYIAFLEQDDVWPTHKISEQVRIFAACPEVGVIFSEIYLCDEANRVAAGAYTSLVNKPPVERPFRAFWHLLWGNCVCTFSNFIVRATCIHPDDILAEPEGFQDWMLLLLLSCRCQFYYCNTTKTFWRQHSESYSAQLRRLPSFRSTRKLALRQAMEKILLDGSRNIQPLYTGPWARSYWQLVISLLSALERTADSVRRRVCAPWVSSDANASEVPEEQGKTGLGRLFREMTPLRATVQHQEQLLERQAEQIAQLMAQEKSWHQERQELQKALEQKDTQWQALQTVVQDQQGTLAYMEEHIARLQTSLQHQQQTLNTIYASLSWHLVSCCWRMLNCFSLLGNRLRAVARMVFQFPSLLLPSNLERIAQYIRLFGLAATYREVISKVRLDSRSIFDGATPIIPVMHTSQVLSHDELPNEPVTISVVIPVKNAGGDLPPLLAMLKNQDGFKGIEIIMVDSGSTDQSREIAEACGAQVIQILPEEFSHSYARNLAAQHASGDYILFTVQDALPPSDLWLYELFKVTKNNDVVAVSCAEFPREDADLFYRALAWNNYRFLQVDWQDRILCRPDIENHLTLRKNANISDIACLIRRDVFMQYQFRGNFAEDLDLGIRLIRDGYKLALLQSTKIIHSHNRPAYYHLKRGYVDNLVISCILPDRPMVAIEAERLFRDLIFLYQVVYALVEQRLSRLTMPCSVKKLSTLVMEQLYAAASDAYPQTIDAAGNEYIDSKFRSFLNHVYQRYYCRKQHPATYDGILLGAMQSFIKIIFSYMDETYEMLDDTVLEDFKVSIYKTYAFICGIQMASCYSMGSQETNKVMKEIHDELTKEV